MQSTVKLFPSVVSSCQLLDTRYHRLQRADCTIFDFCKLKSRNEPVLGKWVADQRSKKKSNKLTADQVEKLNGIGFVWEAR